MAALNGGNSSSSSTSTSTSTSRKRQRDVSVGSDTVSVIGWGTSAKMHRVTDYRKVDMEIDVSETHSQSSTESEDI